MALGRLVLRPPPPANYAKNLSCDTLTVSSERLSIGPRLRVRVTFVAVGSKNMGGTRYALFSLAVFSGASRTGAATGRFSSRR
jgi:hypothetical protein